MKKTKNLIRAKLNDFISKHTVIWHTIADITLIFLFCAALVLVLLLIPIAFIFFYIFMEYFGDYLESMFGHHVLYKLLKWIKISFSKALSILPAVFYRVFSLLFNGFILIPFRLLKYIVIHIYKAIRFSINQGDLYLPYKVIKKAFNEIFFGKG